MPPKDSRLLRVGVLGCGPIAQAAHFESCTKARNATLYAICDVADDLRERMAATHAPEKQFADYDAMLADPDLEAVIIATSDAFHVPAALQSLAGGQACALRETPRHQRRRGGKPARCCRAPSCCKSAI
jgi:predicted dehydrogenase